MFPFPQNPLYKLSPKLQDLDSQIMSAPSINTDTNNLAMLNKTLEDAETNLTNVDKTNTTQYINAMQQVLLTRLRKQQLTSSITKEELLLQKITVLEDLINNTSTN